MRLLAALALALAGCAGPQTQACRGCAVPPPPREEVVVDRAGFVWIHGHWTRDGAAWRWIDGSYARERPGLVYSDGHWTERGGLVVWVDGAWTPAPRYVEDR